MIKLETLKALAATPQFPELKKLIPLALSDEFELVSLLKTYIDSCQSKVCGRCSPCRIGMIRIQTLISHIARNESIPGDLERMMDLAQYVEDASLCALGKGFTTPLLTCYKLFPEEFKHRIADLGAV